MTGVKVVHITHDVLAERQRDPDTKRTLHVVTSQFVKVEFAVTDEGKRNLLELLYSLC